MNLIRRLIAHNRIRQSRKRLARDPNPRNYATLAQQYALIGNTSAAYGVCEEGLAIFPDNVQLSKLRERALRLEREARLAQLRRELQEAPRPALWREMCEILVESGELARAEEEVLRGLANKRDGEALLLLARVRLARFYADRGRAQGKQALESLEEALKALPQDARPLRAKLEFMMKIGAWRDARDVAGTMLKLEPGALELEGRYRTLESQSDGAPSPDRALVEVERTGNFADEREDLAPRAMSGSVQPILRNLAADPDVRAALYVRGGTALVQGPKGATAERTARAVQTILSSSRAAGRRLGLGQIYQIQLEGGFGTLSIAPGEQDAGAVLCGGPLGRGREEVLLGLAGLNAETNEVDA